MAWQIFCGALLGALIMATPQTSAVQSSNKHDATPASSSTAPISIDRPVPPPAVNDKTENLSVEDFLRGLQAMKAGPDNIEQDPDFVNAIRGLSHVAAIYTNEIAKARENGKETDSCPPHGTSTLSTDTLAPFLLRISPEERPKISMNQAFRMYMREQYPCPGKT